MINKDLINTMGFRSDLGTIMLLDMCDNSVFFYEVLFAVEGDKIDTIPL